VIRVQSGARQDAKGVGEVSYVFGIVERDD
jgi:hypothetical protein